MYVLVCNCLNGISKSGSLGVFEDTIDETKDDDVYKNIRENIKRLTESIVLFVLFCRAKV